VFIGGAGTHGQVLKEATFELEHELCIQKGSPVGHGSSLAISAPLCLQSKIVVGSCFELSITMKRATTLL